MTNQNLNDFHIRKAIQSLRAKDYNNATRALVRRWNKLRSEYGYPGKIVAKENDERALSLNQMAQTLLKQHDKTKTQRNRCNRVLKQTFEACEWMVGLQ